MLKGGAIRHRCHGRQGRLPEHVGDNSLVVFAVTWALRAYQQLTPDMAHGSATHCDTIPPHETNRGSDKTEIFPTDSDGIASVYMARLHTGPKGGAAHQSLHLRDWMVRHRKGRGIGADAITCSNSDSPITFMRAEPGVQDRLWCLCIVPDRLAWDGAHQYRRSCGAESPPHECNCLVGFTPAS